MILELELDLEKGGCHIDQDHRLTLDLDSEIEIDLSAGFHFVDAMWVVVEQVADHCLERVDYVEASLLTVVEEGTFDYLVD